MPDVVDAGDVELDVGAGARAFLLDLVMVTGVYVCVYTSVRVVSSTSSLRCPVRRKPVIRFGILKTCETLRSRSYAAAQPRNKPPPPPPRRGRPD